MLQIPKKAKVMVQWKVNPYDYSRDKALLLAKQFSEKYDIDKNNIKVVPDFITLNDKGEDVSVTNDIICNIQDTNFQFSLFKEYIKVNGIDDSKIDFELLKKIDDSINANINYEHYDKYRRFKLKWVRWSNFLSYGEDNYFDFTTLDGLVLLNGDPANQSGKTTFAIDLIHFLFFGKTTKSPTLDKVFNKHIPEATNVIVEGCINIEGNDYVIKRTVTRPIKSRRTSKSKSTQKVEYFKVDGEYVEELTEYVESQEGESSVHTNKAIKEVIGNESDFDLIISATSSNLDELVSKKESERGRLLSRWIGLLPLEEKDALARNTFNSSVKPYLALNKYNTADILTEIDTIQVNTEQFKKMIDKLVGENANLDKDIEQMEENKRSFLEMKSKIDDNILKIDKFTLTNKIDKIITEGKRLRSEIATITSKLDEIGEVDFSLNEYDELVQDKVDKVSIKRMLEGRYMDVKKMINQLNTSQYCPTCGRKYDGIDNSSKINELSVELENIKEEGIKVNKEIETIETAISNLKVLREKFDLKSSYLVKKSALEVKLEQTITLYTENNNILKEYKKNTEAIDKNNEIDIKIRNLDAFLKNKRNTKEYNLSLISDYTNKIMNNEETIANNKKLIAQLAQEEILVNHWKLYLEMVGKNGISKMVLRKTLPIINAQIAYLLADVCDFVCEISINDKNEVIFSLIKDGVVSDISSGSGFELTAASLAIRTVLGNISTMPKMQGLVVDEILGRVAKENYENMHTLFNKILENYDWIIQISHLEEVKDWHSTIITVTKENNISRIITNRK